ncbi:F-box/LRR-repeat protein [Trifolium repens]|nr:F-box/LRR-repeat protein [Trifolium repens]
MLEELNLSYPLGCKNYSNYVDGVEALSLALIKLRKVNLSGFHINNQSLFHLFNNCKHLEEVIILKCDEITSEGLASALRERHTLRSLSFYVFNLGHSNTFPTSHFINTLVSMKGLTSLVLHGSLISDELLYSIAREGLPLIRLDLHYSINYSYNAIFCLLSKCQRIKYLDLQYTYFLEDQHVVKLSSFLRDLVSINLSGCYKLTGTQSVLFTLAKNCPSLSEIKMEKIRELLDLNSFNHTSEGICQVLRKCSKIRHLNLARSKVILLGLNFVVPNLEVLNLSDTKVDDETLFDLKVLLWVI